MYHQLHTKAVAFLNFLLAYLVFFFSMFAKGKLPPGNLANVYTQELKDQTYLLKQFNKYGPIIRVMVNFFLTIAVLGLKQSRQLLAEQDENITSVSFDIKPIVSIGFMRIMKGADHKKYRSILVHVIDPNAMEAHRDFHRTIIDQSLKEYTAKTNNKPTVQQYIDTLDTIGQSIMLHLFFGVTPNTPYYHELTNIYKKIWARDWHNYLSDRQLKAYEEMKNVLLKSLDAKNLSANPAINESILGRIHEAGSLDGTILENLVYMLENARFAIFSLMRWITKYAIDNPSFYTRLSTDPNVFSNEKDCIAQAFVQETLRLNQIENLLRYVRKSFVFEDYVFPKGSMVRLCLLEAHKNPDVFSDPFIFNPQRFLDKHFSLDEYAPFGLGSHRCPLGGVSIQICRLYWRASSFVVCKELKFEC
jgi:cytochrome P450